MSAHVVQAEAANGLRHELALPPCDEFTACRLATRAAALLSIFGNPRRWGGSKVVARHVSSGAVVFAARITPRVRVTERGGVA